MQCRGPGAFRWPNSHAAARSPPLQVLWRVQEDFLHAAMDAVEADHGGVDAYLQRQIGVGAVERRRLAELYLQR